jgi:hypothetical protein
LAGARWPSTITPANTTRKWARTPVDGLFGPSSRPKAASLASRRHDQSGRPAPESCPGSRPAGRSRPGRAVLAELGYDRPQAARRVKVVRCARPRAGNQSPRQRPKWSYRPLSVSILRTRPRIRWSGPRCRPGSGWGRAGAAAAPASHSSTRQDSVMSSVVASMLDPVRVVMTHREAYRGHNPLKPAHRVS